MLLLSSIQVLFLGTIYTLSRKYQYLQMSEGLDNRPMHFHHPMYNIHIIKFRYQVLFLFVGMAICLPFVLCVKREVSEKKKVNPLLLIVPASCDVFATIFDATGLIYVSIINIYA
jgi:hypothetical protein